MHVTYLSEDISRCTMYYTNAIGIAVANQVNDKVGWIKIYEKNNTNLWDPKPFVLRSKVD